MKKFKLSETGETIIGVILSVIMMVIAFLTLIGFPVTACAQDVTKQGTVFVQQSKKVKKEAVKTQYTYKATDGKIYPIYLSAKGKAFIVRVSKKGKEYRQYLPNITKQIGK